jgi:excisionase family DNA binding protein
VTDHPQPGLNGSRPIEAAVHGWDGPVVIIEGIEATALLRYGGLDAYHRQHRGINPYLDRAIGKLRIASNAHRARASGSANGTFRAELAESVPVSGEPLTTQAAGDLLGMTARAVRKAISEGRLAARQSGRAWLIDPENVALYRASKTSRRQR